MSDLTLMLVHAHPDDECLSTGGVIVRCAVEGIRTVLIIAKGGEEGEIVEPALDIPENKARLREIRDQELDCSVRALRVDVLERLGYRDSGMDGTPANSHPEAFHMADKDKATARLVTLVRRYRPQVLVSYDEHGGYGHPDHIACHQITVAAFESAGDPQRFPEAGEPWTPLKLYYTAFPRHKVYQAWTMLRERGLPTPLDNPDFDITRYTVENSQVTTSVPINAYLPQKREAIACHITQIRPEHPFLAISMEEMNELFGEEYFIRAASRVPLPDSGEQREDDLFAGLR